MLAAKMFSAPKFRFWLQSTNGLQPKQCCCPQNLKSLASNYKCFVAKMASTFNIFCFKYKCFAAKRFRGLKFKIPGFKIQMFCSQKDSGLGILKFCFKSKIWSQNLEILLPNPKFVSQILKFCSKFKILS